jgi:Tfp pilus assembly protein PilW
MVELVIATAVALIVVGAPLTFVVISLQQQNVGSSRVAAANQEEVAMARITRDLRQVVPGTTTTFTWSSTSASATMTLPGPGSGGTSTESVTWSCSPNAPGTGTCTRSVNSGTAVTELSNVLSVKFAPVDSAGNSLGGSSSPYTATNPAYVAITFSVLDVSQLDRGGTNAVHGVSNPITLQDGVELLSN